MTAGFVGSATCLPTTDARPRNTKTFIGSCLQVDNDGDAVPMGPGGDDSSSEEDGRVADMDAGGASGCAQQEKGGDDAMDVEQVEQLRGPIVDDDGFQIVQRGRRRR
jgi:hypothetical protein